ncbi:MAG: hypothetical protein D3909_17425 [Candidatus Electrothrix sp. ATG1]|nr:hypothetical protein [Candidatus Electrothrix sp. ATG1]
MNVYMKVPGNSLELNDNLSSFVVSPPEGGEMGVYMKVPGDSLGSLGSTFIFCCSGPEGRNGCLYESTGSSWSRLTIFHVLLSLPRGEGWEFIRRVQ